jgi:hypothetical protein
MRKGAVRRPECWASIDSRSGGIDVVTLIDGDSSDTGNKFMVIQESCNPGQVSVIHGKLFRLDDEMRYLTRRNSLKAATGLLLPEIENTGT